MATNYMAKKKSCASDSSTAPSSPSSITALSYVNNVQNTNGTSNAMQNGIMLNNGNAPGAPATIVNGQNASESPSPGINNNNAPKYGTPVPNRIFVGGISAQTTESELAQLFSAYGSVKATKIIVDRAGVSKGYGFVTFETEMEARRIMREAQCVIFKQRKLNIAPAIKKQPFSRSLEVQSPPIGIPSTVMYANGSPYMFHNGMAFFSPPEPTPNFQAAPANQIPTVPGAATVCPTMMYPCPPGQPLYQYPYQPVPGHMYRNGQTMQYYIAPQPTPHPPPVVNTENSGYCTYDAQYIQYCDSVQSNDVPVPQVVSNPVYVSTVNPPAVTNPTPVYYPASSSKPSKTEEKPHKKRSKMTYRSNNSSPVTESCFVDEGGSGDATSSHTNQQNDYCQKYADNDENYNSNAVYYVMQNSSESGQNNYPAVDNNYVLESSQTQGVYYGNPPNLSVKISNQQNPYPKSNALYYPVPQNTFNAVIGQSPPYPTPSYGNYMHQNGAMYVNNPFTSSCYLSVDSNYGNQTEGKDTNYWRITDEKRSRNAKTNVKVKSLTPCKHKSTSTKEITKDLKSLKM